MQGQETVMIIIAMKEPTFLLAMHPIIGGIDVPSTNSFGGRLNDVMN